MVRYPNITHLCWQLPLADEYLATLKEWLESKVEQCVPEIKLDIFLCEKTQFFLTTMNAAFNTIATSLGIKDPTAPETDELAEAALQRGGGKVPKLVHLKFLSMPNGNW